MIPEIFRDNTTFIKNHSLNTYMFCVLLRIILGLGIITNKLPAKFIIILSVLVIIVFSNKFIKLPKVWKNYLRTVIVYSIVLMLTVLFNNKYNYVSGILIIVDALMGLQTRHIFDRLGYLI